jgi:hypothetical protein
VVRCARGGCGGGGRVHRSVWAGTDRRTFRSRGRLCRDRRGRRERWRLQIPGNDPGRVLEVLAAWLGERGHHEVDTYAGDARRIARLEAHGITHRRCSFDLDRGIDPPLTPAVLAERGHRRALRARRGRRCRPRAGLCRCRLGRGTRSPTNQARYPSTNGPSGPGFLREPDTIQTLPTEPPPRSRWTRSGAETMPTTTEAPTGPSACPRERPPR